MPLSCLEYTDNIRLSSVSIQHFFNQLHAAMKITINCNIESCKSRAYKLSDYAMGLNTNDTGFVLLQIQILSGRSNEARLKLKQTASQILKELIEKENHTNNIQLRVHVMEIDPTFYQMDKIVSSS